MRYGVDDVRTGGVHEPKAKARFSAHLASHRRAVVQRYIITYLAPLATGACFGGEPLLVGAITRQLSGFRRNCMYHISILPRDPVSEAQGTRDVKVPRQAGAQRLPWQVIKLKTGLTAAPTAVVSHDSSAPARTNNEAKNSVAFTDHQIAPPVDNFKRREPYRFKSWLGSGISKKQPFHRRLRYTPEYPWLYATILLYTRNLYMKPFPETTGHSSLDSHPKTRLPPRP